MPSRAEPPPIFRPSGHSHSAFAALVTVTVTVTLMRAASFTEVRCQGLRRKGPKDAARCNRFLIAVPGVKNYRTNAVAKGVAPRGSAIHVRCHECGVTYEVLLDEGTR
jgi:hypothetical protein